MGGIGRMAVDHDGPVAHHGPVDEGAGGDVLPSRARAVVVGGGVIGASVSFHLAELGWSDTLLLERHSFTGGTTWHAAGLVGQLRTNANLTRLIRYSTELYDRLEGISGRATGWRRVGSLSVARTPERMVQLHRSAAQARLYGVECHVLTAEDAQALWPPMEVGDLVGAIHLPRDGRVDPVDLTGSLLAAAAAHGALARQHVEVTELVVGPDGVRGVRTAKGDVECDVVVDCAGMWAAELAARHGAVLPLHAAEHFYAVTEAIDGMTPDLPVLRDPDGRVYCKEETGGLAVGGFEPRAKPWGVDGMPPDEEFALLPEDWDHFSVLMERAVERVPALATAGVRILYNGPESFTPDGQFLLGEVPGLRRCFVAAGFNSMGIASAGGAGWALAHWIADGRPPFDLWPVDVRRFGPAHANVAYRRDRVVESVGLHYAMPWPDRELETARPLRRSPVHHLLEVAGARFGVVAGWERANFYDPDGAVAGRPSTWEAPPWRALVAGEQRRACLGVGLADESSVGTLLVQGEDAGALLDSVCVQDPAFEPGHWVRTAALDDGGRYRAVFDVLRLGQAEYLVLAEAGQATKDLDLLGRAVPPGGRATVADVSAGHAQFAVLGPRAADLLVRTAPANRFLADLGEGSLGRVELGYATGVATRRRFAGNDRWDVLVPADQAVHAFERLSQAGAPLGLALLGRYALDALGVEGGHRRWGRDLTSDWTPLEASLDGEPSPLAGSRRFVGRDALDEQRCRGLGRRLVTVVLDQALPMAWGGEVLFRDGEPVGALTSAAFSPALGRVVALASLASPPHVVLDDAWVRGGRYEVLAGDRTVVADLHPGPVAAGAEAVRP